jgi:hypothetical protein
MFAKNYNTSKINLDGEFFYQNNEFGYESASQIENNNGNQFLSQNEQEQNIDNASIFNCGFVENETKMNYIPGLSLEYDENFCFICKKQSCNCFSELDVMQDSLSFAGLSQIDTRELTGNKNQDEEKLIVPKLMFDFYLPALRNKAHETKDSSQMILSSTKSRNATIKDYSEESEEVELQVIKPTSTKYFSKKNKNDSNLFLVRRAWFRGFSEYFKNKFAASNYSWQRKRGNKKKKTPMMALVQQFAEQEFGSLITNLSNEKWIEFRHKLLTVLFSHRYKKNDDFVEGIDFTNIRNVLYHYTTESRKEVLKDAHFCFLIHHFYMNDQTNFLQAKIQEKSKLNHGHLRLELDILDQEAILMLQRNFPF